MLNTQGRACHKQKLKTEDNFIARLVVSRLGGDLQGLWIDQQSYHLYTFPPGKVTKNGGLEGVIVQVRACTAVFMWHFGNMSANKSLLITDVTFMATSAMQAHRWSRPCIKMYGKYRWRTAIDSSLLLCTAQIYKCLLRVESFYGETERWIP